MLEEKMMMLKDFLRGLKTTEFQLTIEESDQIEEDDLTFILFEAEELEEAQLGYSVDDEGNSLIGTAEGDWKAEWIVIGYEEDLGDPLIADTSKEGFSVFTAEHGAGDWTPILLFDSLVDMNERNGLS